MVDLSHWNFAKNFSGFQISALILGVDPYKPNNDIARIHVVQDRLALDYQRAVQRALAEFGPFKENLPARPDDLFVSADLDELWSSATALSCSDLEAWAIDEEKSNFSRQKFSRNSVISWVKSTGVTSKYKFDLNEFSPLEVDSEDSFDPADLPEELFLANIAFRAVKNGHGNPSATYRNRLIDYLKKEHPELNNEAIDRIATVANPDKSRGRKKNLHN